MDLNFVNFIKKIISYPHVIRDGILKWEKENYKVIQIRI